MTLLGLVGRKRSGKDTFAQYLVRHAGFARVAFADELKREIAEIMGITVEELEQHKDRYRGMFQDYGTRKRQEDSTYWIAKVAAHIDWLSDTYGVSRVVVADVRLPNEASWVRARGGGVVRLIRADGLHADDPHESEAGQDRIRVDDSWTCGTSEGVEMVAEGLAQRMGWMTGRPRG